MAMLRAGADDTSAYACALTARATHMFGATTPATTSTTPAIARRSSCAVAIRMVHRKTAQKPEAQLSIPTAPHSGSVGTGSFPPKGLRDEKLDTRRRKPPTPAKSDCPRFSFGTHTG